MIEFNAFYVIICFKINSAIYHRCRIQRWQLGTIEYRLALVNRKGIACHFDVEVKNTSNQKLDIVVKSDYYDQLVKGKFSELLKRPLKAEKSAVISTLLQGCKKDKSKDLSDYDTCMACDYGLSIFVYN